MLPSSVRRTLPQLTKAIREARKRGEFCPTVTALTHADDRHRVLIGRSARSDNLMFFPKGSIEQKENIIRALYREAREEANMRPSTLTVMKYVGFRDDLTENGRLKKGYVRGKRHFVFSVAYRGPKKLEVCAEEIAEYWWVDSSHQFFALAEAMHVSDARLLRLFVELQAAGIKWAKRSHQSRLLM